MRRDYHQKNFLVNFTGFTLVYPDDAFPFTFTPLTAFSIIQKPHILIRGSSSMIVIGIDPGLARLGYGVIEVTNGEIRAIRYGCIETSGKDLRTSERLLKIYSEVEALFENYKPVYISLEKLFFTRNVSSAMGVSEVRGIILLAAEQQNIRRRVHPQSSQAGNHRIRTSRQASDAGDDQATAPAN